MKKVYVLVAVVLASFGTFASTEGTIVSIENKKDIKEIPKAIQKQMEIVYAENMSKVLEYALL